ncbi:MAG TPA: hypothetical protein VF524_14950 [Polyangia bacterium]
MPAASARRQAGVGVPTTWPMASRFGRGVKAARATREKRCSAGSMMMVSTCATASDMVSRELNVTGTSNSGSAKKSVPRLLMLSRRTCSPGW